MSFAFMPVYTGDYLRDTQHLSCSEHGIYFKLLMHCWDQRGPAPWDERKLAGIVNARSADEVEALRRVLGEFFVRMDDGWYNRRMMREVEKAAALSERLSTAGKLGARKRNSLNRQGIPAKAKPGPSTASAEAQPLLHTPTTTTTPTTNPKKDSLTTSGVAIPPCPVRKIVTTYNEVCTSCTRSEVPTTTLHGHITARWRQLFADGAASDYESAGKFFADFFNRVQVSKFLTGQAKARDGGKPFRASLRWLMKPENFAKTIEGEYDNR